MVKPCNSGEPSQEWWPTDQNYPTSAGRCDDSSKRSTKDPTTPSKELHAVSKVSVHDSTIRKRLGKNGLHGRETVRPSVHDLKLKRTWVLQQDNDPKHTSKSTSEWLKEKQNEDFGVA
ncbi:hypothetical protein L3Q82_015140 [Scortum barcoo]|uniref:Uncharacterized protein n=1 Tax=Scortum barcoo TaxID=214431 RepID=A0ACB8VSR2_9TELE|nr:hypothetical protein L3Q82_015140 [Scortum barcoo]